MARWSNIIIQYTLCVCRYASHLCMVVWAFEWYRDRESDWNKTNTFTKSIRTDWGSSSRSSGCFNSIQTRRSILCITKSLPMIFFLYIRLYFASSYSSWWWKYIIFAPNAMSAIMFVMSCVVENRTCRNGYGLPSNIDIDSMSDSG